MGKQTFLLVAGEDAVPSDFVHSEWIRYEKDDEPNFGRSVAAAFSEMKSYAKYVEDLALTAEDAEEIDIELAFERFRRAYLVSKSQAARDGISRLRRKLRSARDESATGSLMKSYRRRLLDEIAHFERLCAGD